MILNLLFKFLPNKVFRLGTGEIIRYKLIEIKWLFSIYFHQIKTFEQDRFHTHAFNACVFIIKGGYEDEIKYGLGKDKPTVKVKFKAFRFRYIPRLLNHKILQAEPGTVSVLFTGPYSHLWTEETDKGVLRILTTGSKSILDLPL